MLITAINKLQAFAFYFDLCNISNSCKLTKESRMKKLGLFTCLLLLLNSFPVISLQPTKYFKAVVHPSCGNVLVTWSNVVDAEGYDIYRLDEGQSSFDRIVQLNTEKLYYKDSKNIVSDKTIKYYITAVGKDGNTLFKTPELATKAGCYDEQECNTRLKFQVGNFMYWVNDKMDGPMNAAPEQTNGRVFLVIKYITTTIGAKLDWLASEKKATITTADKVIELWIGKNQAKINGSMVKIDSSNEKVSPYLSNGRTMLPMRFVGDNLGASEIKWDAETKTATILIPKKCSEPDCHTLVVDSFKDNLITGKNSAGFKISFDRSQLGQKEIEIGDIVTVCGVFEMRDYGVHIAARKLNKLTNTSGNWINCQITSIDDARLTVKVKQCDGKEQSYTYTNESRVNILPKTFPVCLFVVNGVVVNWKYIENDRICKEDPLSSVDLTITDVDCSKMVLKGEVTGTNPVTTMAISMPSEQWCIIKPGTCLRIEYFFDGLGAPVGSAFKEIDCPCDFELITASSKITATTGSSFKMEFKIKNTGKYGGVIEPTVESENFPGKISVSPASEDIPPGKISYFTIEGQINDDFEGETEFVLKAKCRNVANEKKITVIVSPPMFQVSAASGVTEVPTDENVNLSFDVTNYSEGPITVMAMIEKTDFPGKLTIEPISKEVPNKNTRSFTITGVWNPKIKPGTSYSITYSVTCGKVTKSEKATVTAGVPGPIITLVEGSGDAKGYTVLDGSINWKHYTKSRVEVNWDDGVTEDVKDIPTFHQYKKKGEFKVKVTAFTKEGVNVSQTCKCYWEGPKPIVNLTGFKWNQPVFTLEGNIDWNTLKSGKITVDWDDGTKENKSGFPMSHSYSGPGLYLIKVTAISSTGEEGFAIRPLLLIPGLMNANRSISPELLSYY